MEFTSSELCDATKNYCKKAVIGQGGFGKVYKGVLRGSLTAAIKVLSQVKVVSVASLLCHIWLIIKLIGRQTSSSKE